MRSTVHAHIRNSRAPRQKLTHTWSSKGSIVLKDCRRSSLFWRLPFFALFSWKTCSLSTVPPRAAFYLPPIRTADILSACRAAPFVRMRRFAPNSARRGRRIPLPLARRSCRGLVRSTQRSWPQAAAHDEPSSSLPNSSLVKVLASDLSSSVKVRAWAVV